MIIYLLIMEYKDYSPPTIKKALSKQVDEHLHDFFSSISGQEQKIWYATEAYHRKLLNISKLSDENF